MSNYLNWGHENPEQIQARRKYQTEMFEAMASAKAAANAAAAAGSSHPKPPSYFNESILWFEYNEETGEITRFVYNCDYSQILGPAKSAFNDPWYVNETYPSNGGGYLIQWVNDDTNDTKYEFVNSMNQSVHISEALSNSTHQYWSDYTFDYSAQMVSYYTVDNSDTLKWVILHKNDVYEYTFDNVDWFNLENTEVDGVMLIQVNQLEGPSNTLVANLYMVGAGFTTPLKINSTTPLTDYFRFGLAYDHVTTAGGDYVDTWANHFYVVEQLGSTDEILQMKTYDKTGTLLFDLYEQLVNDYELDPSNYYLEDWDDFGSGKMFFWLGNRDTNYYRLVLVSKEAGVYYVSESDSDVNGNWDSYELSLGITRNGESFCYLYYNNEENYHFGFNQDGDWEMYLVGADGTSNMTTGTGDADYWETMIGKDGSAVFPCLVNDDGYYIASCTLPLVGSPSYKLLSDYELIESGYYDGLYTSYDHIAKESELFLYMRDEANLFIIVHIDGAGTLTRSVVMPAEFDTSWDLETNDPGFERQIIFATGDGDVYWFNRASKEFVKLLAEINYSWTDSTPRYYGSKQNAALIWIDYSPMVIIKSDGSVIYGPANGQIVASLGKSRYSAITTDGESQYVTVYSLVTGEPLTPAVPFGNMWIDGMAGNRLSLYDYYAGAVKCLTFASTYAYKYQNDNYFGRTYNDMVWWND